MVGVGLAASATIATSSLFGGLPAGQSPEALRARYEFPQNSDARVFRTIGGQALRAQQRATEQARGEIQNPCVGQLLTFTYPRDRYGNMIGMSIVRQKNGLRVRTEFPALSVNCAKLYPRKAVTLDFCRSRGPGRPAQLIKSVTRVVSSRKRATREVQTRIRGPIYVKSLPYLLREREAQGGFGPYWVAVLKGEQTGKVDKNGRVRARQPGSGRIVCIS